MALPQAPAPPRKKVEYRKPRRLNVVSLTLLAMALTGGYLLYAAWPLLALRSQVRDELADALPTLWKLNLRPEGQARIELAKLRRVVVEKLRKKGVRDQKLELVIDRNKKRVGMEARYAATAQLPGLDRKLHMNFRPRVETDAERNDW
jgi:hypothetical protein